ncbi:MAG: ATP-binding protein [Rickettsiaceae bacterium]|nr:ATP-binding protein [Rickettsiaceae bacterium]
MLLDWQYLDKILIYESIKRYNEAVIDGICEMPLESIVRLSIREQKQCISSIWYKEIITKLSVKFPLLKQVRNLNGRHYFDLVDSSIIGIFPLQCEDDFLSQRWIDFRGKMVSALKNAGCKHNLSHALSHAMSELADNIIQHSEPHGTLVFKGIAAFAVVDNYLSIVISDAGRGILASLRENSKNKLLKTDMEAIVAAAKDNCSRREDNMGTGFRQLFQSIADLHGEVHIVSGCGRVVFKGIGQKSLTVITSTSEIGSHVFIKCIFKK